MTIIRGSPFFIAGGTLPPGAPSYIARRADEELLEGLLAGEFCYVLTSRQMGKSSLMVRTAARLREAGVRVATLDLTAIGRNLSPDRWYYALLLELADSLGREEVVEANWSDVAAQAPLHGFLRALRKLIHCAGESPVVVFVDEVDYVRSLPFSVDEFFAAIRACYNERAADPAWNRLTFCLLGVSAPTDLIRDPRVTPFNIGRPIPLDDFSLEEALPLEAGLLNHAQRATPLLQRILHWTGGHPYLTQKLLRTLSESGQAPEIKEVDAACWRLFLEPREREIDSNLLFVRETLLHSGEDLPACLDTYGRVLAGRAVRDAESDRIAGILRLSGIVRVSDGLLHPRNAIYERVFDRKWIAEQMPDAERRRQRAAYRRGVLRTAGIALAALSILLWMLLWNLRVTRLAQQSAADARRLLYFADMLQASQAWEGGNLRRLNELLTETRTNENRAFEWDYWNRLTQLDIALALAGNASSCSAVAPDGSSLAMTNGTTMSIYDPLLPSAPRSVFSGAQESPLALSLGGKWVATLGSQTHEVSVWKVQSGARQSVTHLRDVYNVGFSPDGQEIVAIDKKDDLLVCDSLSGRLLRTLHPPKEPSGATPRIVGYCFSPDGREIATSCDDGVIRIWTGATLARKIHGAAQGGTGIAYSPDGQRIASCGEDQWLMVWRTTDGKLLQHTRMPDALACLSFSPDGRRLATAGAGGTVRLWEVASLRSLFSLRGHEHALTQVAFTPEGQHLVSRDESGRVKLWRADGDHAVRELVAHKGYALSAIFLPDGERIVTIGGDLVARVWDCATGQPLLTLRGHTADLYAADASRDGKWIVTGAEDKSARIWDAATGKLAHVLQGHTGRVNTVRFSPDSTLVMTAGEDHTAVLWEVSTGKSLRTFPYPDRIWSATFSPDGSRVALGGMAGTVEVRRVADGHLECTARNAGTARSVAFSADGTWIAGTTASHTAAIWDSHTGQLVRQFLGHENVVTSVCFSSDGRRLLTSAYDGTARLWDTATGREVLTLRSNGAKLSSAQFSPNGRRIVTARMDGRVSLFSSE